MNAVSNGPDPAQAARLTTFVPCADYFDVRDAALLAHATQIDPDGFWFAIPREIQLEVAPTEDFELARSIVPATMPEDDLFAGVRELEDPDEVCRRAPARTERERHLGDRRRVGRRGLSGAAWRDWRNLRQCASSLPVPCHSSWCSDPRWR